MYKEMNKIPQPGPGKCGETKRNKKRQKNKPCKGQDKKTEDPGDPTNYIETSEKISRSPAFTRFIRWLIKISPKQTIFGPSGPKSFRMAMIAQTCP